jgi:hypothetical protein
MDIVSFLESCLATKANDIAATISGSGISQPALFLLIYLPVLQTLPYGVFHKPISKALAILTTTSPTTASSLTLLSVATMPVVSGQLIQSAPLWHQHAMNMWQITPGHF